MVILSDLDEIPRAATVERSDGSYRCTYGPCGLGGKGLGRIWLHSARHSTRSCTDKQPSTVVVEGCGTASSQATPSSSFETTCSRSTGSIRSLRTTLCLHARTCHKRHAIHANAESVSTQERTEQKVTESAQRFESAAAPIQSTMLWPLGAHVWLPQGSKGTTCANQTFAGGYSASSGTCLRGYTT